MKRVFRKNQVIITALALMIAVAGYVSYTKAGPGEDVLKTASDEVADTADTYDISDEDMVADIFTDTEEDAQASDSTDDGITNEGDASDSSDTGSSDTGSSDTGSSDTGSSDAAPAEAGETLLTSAEAQTVDFSSEVKLNREQVRGKNKEALMEIIDSTSISDAQKQDAVNTMIEMTNIAERENAAELLLEAKGFQDAVVSVTDNSADVVLDMGDVTDAKRAQVEDIVKRKTGIAAENIVITPISGTQAGQK